MRVDVSLGVSHWQPRFHCVGGLVVLLLIHLSGLDLITKFSLSGLFILLQIISMRWLRQPALQQLWQDDNSQWYWRIQGQTRIHKGKLLTLRSYGIAIFLMFDSNHQKRGVWLWRDQMPPDQWRYLMIRSHLK